MIWGLRYDELCTGPGKTVLTYASVVVNAAGKASDLLRATAVNHATCDEKSAIGSVGVGAALFPEAPVFPAPVIVPAVGGGAAPPAWWLTIQPYVRGGVWPNGNASQLGNAAAAWTGAADVLSAAVGIASEAMSFLANQNSAEMPKIIANCQLVMDAINSVIVCCRFASASCIRYAAAISRARIRIIETLQPLDRSGPLGTEPVLIPVLGADSQITVMPRLATVVQLKEVGAKISALIDVFLGSAKSDVLVGKPLAGASESISKLGPILQARPTLFGAGEFDGVTVASRGARIAKNTEDSVIGRLDTYLLNPEHDVGCHKAKLFQELFGYTQENMDFFADQIIFNPIEAVECETTQYGTKFNQVINIEGLNGKIAPVKFTWQRDVNGVVRLITASPAR
ncbi:MAG: hypothetical protein K2Q25_08755 [Mycobacteriaceae bacterium]|nr:hypothetical protein [Mycobacteriaceae bacterium]